MSSCLVCEENTENATLYFASTSSDYQLLDTEGSRISYNYSYWASRCADMLFMKYIIL